MKNHSGRNANFDQDRKHRLDILHICREKRLGKPFSALLMTMLQCISVSVRHPSVIAEKKILWWHHLISIVILTYYKHTPNQGSILKGSSERFLALRETCKPWKPYNYAHTDRAHHIVGLVYAATRAWSSQLRDTVNAWTHSFCPLQQVKKASIVERNQKMIAITKAESGLWHFCAIQPSEIWMGRWKNQILGISDTLSEHSQASLRIAHATFTHP